MYLPEHADGRANFAVLFKRGSSIRWYGPDCCRLVNRDEAEAEVQNLRRRLAQWIIDADIFDDSYLSPELRKTLDMGKLRFLRVSYHDVDFTLDAGQGGAYALARGRVDNFNLDVTKYYFRVVLRANYLRVGGQRTMQSTVKRGILAMVLALTAAALSSCGVAYLSRYTLVPLVLPVRVQMPIDLSQAGSVAESEFIVKVPDVYRMQLNFETSRDKENNEVSKYLGDLWGDCTKGAGTIIPLHLTVSKKTAGGTKVIMDEYIYEAYEKVSLSRTMDLGPGRYRIRLTNLLAHRHLQYVLVTVTLIYYRYK